MPHCWKSHVTAQLLLCSDTIERQREETLGMNVRLFRQCILQTVTFPYVSWSTSELRVRWVQLTMIKPLPQWFLLAFPRWCFFCGSFLLSCFTLVLIYTVVSVPCSLVRTRWERAGLLAILRVMFPCVFVTFPYGVLGRVWFLIVLIPDICLLLYILYVCRNRAHFGGKSWCICWAYRRKTKTAKDQISMCNCTCVYCFWR